MRFIVSHGYSKDRMEIDHPWRPIGLWWSFIQPGKTLEMGPAFTNTKLFRFATEMASCELVSRDDPGMSFHIPIPSLSYSHSRTVVPLLQRKYFLAYRRLKPNTQYHTALSVLCLSLNLKLVTTVIITEHHKQQKIYHRLYAEWYSTLMKNGIHLFLART